MELRDHEFERLRAASEDGFEFDGLKLGRTPDGYVIETPVESGTELTKAEFRTALEAVDEYVTNWRYWQEAVDGDGTAGRAFLRWCERAPTEADGSDASLPVPGRYEALRDGIDRTWGQLRVTARFLDVDEPDGERVYDLWHVDDADTPLSELEVYDQPREARDISTYDENGQYRPLKTAPTLRSGWAFTGLSGTELVDAVDFFYPATVANWHREREGALDVDHWTETAERQTGIYDVIDELPREAVEWMAEACCVDSQCLRRREWQYEERDQLDVDGGDGKFPCREPCSLVIAAARKWAILESESEKTYELELTTSELNQLEELIDAVAEGRVDDVREADVNEGANRYRARYLRAKRFEDGSLDAVESSEPGQ
ncbi:DR2241 family protein [Halostagnicola bangensis]